VAGSSAPSIRAIGAAESRGLIRAHTGSGAGGAAAYEPFRYDSSFLAREQRYAEQKRRIAWLPRNLWRPMNNLLTAGTTTTHVGRSLRHRDKIQWSPTR